MKKNKLQKFNKILVGLRKQALLSVEQSSVQNESIEGDEIDITNTILSNAMQTQFSDRALTQLRQIEEALRRINSGNFGICSECEEPINEARLLSRPTTTLCIACKEEQEREDSAHSRNHKRL